MNNGSLLVDSGLDLGEEPDREEFGAEEPRPWAWGIMNACDCNKKIFIPLEISQRSL